MTTPITHPGEDQRLALAARLEAECIVRENNLDDYCYDLTKLFRECVAALRRSAPDEAFVEQAHRDSTWLDLSASEKACYDWPEDTDLHRQCRAAYVAGATDYTRSVAPDVRQALEHARVRFQCLSDQFDEAGDTASWAMASVDSDRMTKALASLPVPGTEGEKEIQSSDGRTDEAMARAGRAGVADGELQTDPVSGIGARRPHGLPPSNDHASTTQTGVGSERSSPSETIPASDRATCECCQGNGEIVTNWNDYLHPANREAEEKSVAECPNCDGEGKVSTAPAPRREAEGEAVAWRVRLESGEYQLTSHADIADMWRNGGAKLEPLYAAPPPQRGDAREEFEDFIKRSGFTDWTRHEDGYLKPLVERLWRAWSAPPSPVRAAAEPGEMREGGK